MLYLPRYLISYYLIYAKHTMLFNPYQFVLCET